MGPRGPDARHDPNGFAASGWRAPGRDPPGSGMGRHADGPASCSAARFGSDLAGALSGGNPGARHETRLWRRAQRVWDQAAAAGTLANLRRIVFLDAARHHEAVYVKSYGLIYGWIPFEQYRHRTDCERQLGAVSKALAPEGAAIMVGPAWLGEACPRVSLRVRIADPVAQTPGVRMHQAILPKARVNPDATLFFLQKL